MIKLLFESMYMCMFSNKHYYLTDVRTQGLSGIASLEHLIMCTQSEHLQTAHNFEKTTDKHTIQRAINKTISFPCFRVEDSQY